MITIIILIALGRLSRLGGLGSREKKWQTDNMMSCWRCFLLGDDGDDNVDDGLDDDDDR